MNNKIELKKLERIGLIAGTGGLPEILAEQASNSNIKVIAIALSNESVSSLESVSHKVFHIGIGQASKIIKTLKKERISDAIMIGKFDKTILYKTKIIDLRALNLIRKMKFKDDKSLMTVVINELEAEGINCLDQSLFLEDLFPAKGVLTKKKPGKAEWEDINYGFSIAKEMAKLEIGQTVIVKDKSIVAVEAMEGTDQTIIRGAKIVGKGAVMVKVSRPNQDLRYDIPAVGETTLSSLVKGKASVLALEAGKTILVNKDRMIEIANKYKISIVAV